MYATGLYSNSPVMLQEKMIEVRARFVSSLREGKSFRSMVADCTNTQWYSSRELAAFHRKKLGELISHAGKNVPFYEEYWGKMGAPWEDILHRLPEDVLAALPFITKANVQEAAQLMLADTAKKPLIKSRTSGTTGTPLVLYRDLSALNRENAFIARNLLWAGYVPGGRRAWIRGDMIVPINDSQQPFWRRNKAENMLMFSAYHLSETSAPAYLDALARFDPMIIQAYPSSIGFLAAYLESSSKTYSGVSLKSVITASETLSEEQRRVIETRFGCRVFDCYGQNEQIAAIVTCEHRRYHVLSDYSYVEFLPVGDGLFEIVGTGYNNLAMPLIRYRTGDLVELDGDEPCPCGRAFPTVKRIHGRNDDYIKLPDGRRIGRMAKVFVGLDGLIEAQIVQYSMDELLIRVVPGPCYGEKTERRLKQNFKDRLGDKIRITIEKVETIERTKNGKVRNVICNV